MNDQTNKNDPNNRGRSELDELLRTIWLGVWFRNITDLEVECDVEQIRELLGRQ